MNSSQNLPASKGPLVRVSIVEDNRLFRKMLEDIGSSIDGLEVVTSYGTLEGIRTALRSQIRPPDYIVMDIILPDGKGWEILSEDPVRTGRTKVFFASGIIDQQSLLYFAQRKVLGFIDKGSSELSDWKEAFTCMAQNRGYCSESLIADILNVGMSSNHWSKLLTKKELEILPLLVDGGSNHEIGETLKVSPLTIQVHRKNIMRKIDVRSALGLMRWAKSMGISS